MSRGKNLTYKMKKYVHNKMRLDPDEWVYTKNTPTELYIQHKITGEKKIIDKIERNITTF